MSGFTSGLAAYVIWGLFPLYWKLIERVPALQIIGHRVVWSFVALAVVAVARRGQRHGPRYDGGTFAIYILAAVLITINSFLYVYAVNTDRILETSLGYFIAPLVNVLLGVLVLRERLRPPQWGAVALAAAGVLHLTIAYGSPPWIAMGLAVSFGSYGLVKKKAPLDSFAGLTLETGILVIPAVVYLLLLNARGASITTAKLR